MRLGAAQAQIHFLAVVTDLGAADGALSCVMGKVTGAVLFLHEKGVAGVLHMGRADAHRPMQLRHVRPQIKNGAALIHVDACTHIRVAVPEHLLVAAVEDVPPQRALRLGVGLLFPVVIGKFGHGHIHQLALFFQLAVVSAAIPIGLFQQLIGRFPASHFVHPAGADKHHVVGVAVVVLGQTAVLVDQIVQVGIFPCFRIIDHTAKHILGVGAEVGAVAVIAGQQVAAQVRNGDNAGILVLVGRWRVGVGLGGDPWRPWAAVHESIP